MRAAPNDEGWDTIVTHSLGLFEVSDSCTDFVGWNGRHTCKYSFIHLFSIPEIHQSGYRTCH